MNLTRKAIINSFWELLEEKPYNKITVKDIAQKCEVNRNTFYYHFHDIPELLECMLKDRVDEIIKEYSNTGSPKDCIVPIVKYTLDRKTAVMHIYHSMERETFLDNLDRISEYVVTEYIESLTLAPSISEEDKTALIRFYKCALVGVSLDWLKDGMKYDIEDFIVRINDIFVRDSFYLKK